MQDIARFGTVMLTVIYVMAIAVDASRTTHDYPAVMDNRPHTRPREIRGFKNHPMSTARGYGKRQGNSLEKSKLSRRHDATMLLPFKDVTQRFPVDWFVQLSKISPQLVLKVHRNLFSDEKNAVRSSVVERYKKNESDDTYDYDD